MVSRRGNIAILITYICGQRQRLRASSMLRRRKTQLRFLACVSTSPITGRKDPILREMERTITKEASYPRLRHVGAALS